MEKSVQEIIKNISEQYQEISGLQKYCHNSNDFICEELSEHNECTLYALREKGGVCQFILRVHRAHKFFDEVCHLPNCWLEIDAKCTHQFNNICPQLVQKIICRSESDNAELLEGLNGFSSLRNQLVTGDVHMSAFSNMGSQLATIHCSTNLNREDGAQLLDSFGNNEITTLRINQTFSWAVHKTHLLTILPTTIVSTFERICDNITIESISKLQSIYTDKKLCLIHGNLIPASLWTNSLGAVKLTGLFSAHVGPPSFDLGCLIAGLITAYHTHMLTPENNDSHRQVAYEMITASKDFVDSYICKVRELEPNTDTDKINDLLSETAGFCGCILLKMTLLSAYEKTETSTETEILSSASRLFHAWHRIHSIGALLNIALALLT